VFQKNLAVRQQNNLEQNNLMFERWTGSELTPPTPHINKEPIRIFHSKVARNKSIELTKRNEAKGKALSTVCKSL